MIRDDIWPFLRERGFKRTKATFHRPVGDNWQVVNFQRSSFSDAEHIPLYINLGVALARLRDGSRDWPEGKRPLEYQCHFRERLGSILRDGTEASWDVRPDTDTSSLADALTLALERYGFPWLDARSSDEGVIMVLSNVATRRKNLSWLNRSSIAGLARLARELGYEDVQRVLEQEVERIERRRQLEGP